MAHYAFLNKKNIVTEVIPGRNENELGIDWEQYYGNERGQVCKRTSYNTIHGVHIKGGTPFRKHYAGIGDKYDPEKDAFIPQAPELDWTFNEETWSWEPPIQIESS